MQQQRGIGVLALIIILAVVALAGGALVLNKKQSAPSLKQEQVSSAPTPAPTSSSGIPTSLKDTSDTAMDKDSADVDTKLNTFDRDSASIDAGLNDKQGDLSE